MTTGLKPKLCLRIFMTVSLNYETPAWHQHFCFSIFYSYLNKGKMQQMSLIILQTLLFVQSIFTSSQRLPSDLSLPESISFSPDYGGKTQCPIFAL